MITNTPPERTPRKRDRNEPRDEYAIYYDNFWAERDIKKPPATSIATLNGRGIDVDEIGERYYADNGEPVNKPNRLWQAILSFIDWLNSRMGATEHKPKRKAKRSVEQILYGHVPEWFKDEMMSRPENETECFYHPPINVSHTPHEWIDGEISGRRHGAWRPVEQMLTFDELFEEKQEITE